MYDVLLYISILTTLTTYMLCPRHMLAIIHTYHKFAARLYKLVHLMYLILISMIMYICSKIVTVRKAA